MQISQQLESCTFLRILPKKKRVLETTHTSVFLLFHEYCLLEQIFYVIEGAVEAKIHQTRYVLAPGAMFMVPRGKKKYPRGCPFHSSNLQEIITLL